LRGFIPKRSNSNVARVPHDSSVRGAALPPFVDWRTKGVVTPVKNQAACGSCWSFGAAEAIESHWAIKTGKLVVLSEQNILDCTQNPRHCGGTGGCGGATFELAFEAMKNQTGIAAESTYPYQSGGGQNFPCRFDKQKTPVAATVTGYVGLPSNQYTPLMNAVANQGPISITVDASAWSLYGSGVFDGCNQGSPDLDHAVLLVGYGTDAQKGDYWLIRNSWDASWGEQGYIRLRRTAAEETRCAFDTNPGDGTACDGDPPKVWVCGTCGILYDTAYPLV